MSMQIVVGGPHPRLGKGKTPFETLKHRLR